MPSPDSEIRERLRLELEQARVGFQDLVAAFSQQGWDAPSQNPNWTNGQLLFHIAFAFMLVPPLCRLMRLFGHVSRNWSRRFAAVLNASTPVFNRINALGPRLAARHYRGEALSRKYDRVYAAIRKQLDLIGDDEWTRGMHYPVRWDPRFGEYVTFAELFRYPMVHFEHHRGQLRVA